MMNYEKPASSGPEPKFKPRLIIHGGAGNASRENITPDKYEAYRAALISFVTRTNAYMTTPVQKPTQGRPLGSLPSALEVATFAVVQLEDHPLFNSGHGAVFTRDGINELEASVMVSRGYKKRGVGVMGLRHVRNPILLARKMLEHGEEDLVAASGPDVPSAQGHTQLFGETAEKLARQYGLDMVDPSYFFTQHRWDEHIRSLEREGAGRGLASWDAESYLPQGTVGAVALDEDGVICTATSTGGLTNKLTGRIGDTPAPGAGFWAEEWTEGGDPTGSRVWSPRPDQPAMILSGALKGMLADCLPTPWMYSPLQEPHRCLNATTTTRSIAVSGTGNGDSFLRVGAARTTAAMARFKPEPGADAVTHVAGPGGELQRSAGERWMKTGEGEGGMIGIECAVVRGEDGGLVEARAAILQDYNCGGMFRAWIDDDGKAVMSIWTNGSPDKR
ncbi:nucleophile aminohydrolase [Stachybotrys elegans]|uniref:Nucleophile aminohydrolase n=1 Tax=Stachybotrys elegans TaxID=80388 RepID=A0A8K0SMP3_9HYPO|nr:nucleophile aminohydrolase [Stachybotrys elegans]